MFGNDVEWLCLKPVFRTSTQATLLRKLIFFKPDRGVDVLGYRVFPNYRLLRNDNGHRFARRLRGFAVAYYQGLMEFGDFNPSVQNWIGYAKQAESYGLRRQLFGSIIFKREKSRKSVRA